MDPPLDAMTVDQVVEADATTSNEHRMPVDPSRARIAELPNTDDASVFGEHAQILDRALVMFTLRRVAFAEEGGFRIDRSQDPLLRFYANSIAHFFEAV